MPKWNFTFTFYDAKSQKKNILVIMNYKNSETSFFGSVSMHNKVPKHDNVLFKKPEFSKSTQKLLHITSFPIVFG